jgi:hypothetical protein
MDPRLAEKFVSPLTAVRGLGRDSAGNTSSSSHSHHHKRKLPEFIPDSDDDDDEQPPSKQLKTPKQAPYTFGAGSSQAVDVEDVGVAFEYSATQYESPVVVGPQRATGRSGGIGGGLKPRDGYGIQTTSADENDSYWMVQWYVPIGR